MPYITVDHFAGVEPNVRRQMQQRIAQTVTETFGAKPQDVRVFTRAFDEADCYRGDGEVQKALPLIRAEFMAGRTIEMKRSLMVKLATVVSESLGVDVEQIRTVFYETERRHFCFGTNPME